MRFPTALCVLALLAATGLPARGDSDHREDTRKRLSCPKLRQKMERAARILGFEDRIAPNSWGEIPPDLRKLPPGGELCGVDSELGQVVIASPLDGKELEAYYAPLFEKIGCQPLTCNRGKLPGDPEPTRCRCAVPGLVGNIRTDPNHQAFQLAISR
jgi:hypothetical protein